MDSADSDFGQQLHVMVADFTRGDRLRLHLRGSKQTVTVRIQPAAPTPDSRVVQLTLPLPNTDGAVVAVELMRGAFASQKVAVLQDQSLPSARYHVEGCCLLAKLC